MITADDRVYYTDYARGFLGRLDPQTRQVEEWASPGGSRSSPYGITATSDSRIWYSESGVTPNTLVGFDPVTWLFSTTKIPSGGGVVRNMAVTSKDDLYIACSGVNKVGIAQIRRAGP